MLHDQQDLEPGAPAGAPRSRIAYLAPERARENASAALAAARTAWAAEDCERVLWLLERMGPASPQEQADAAVLRARAYLHGGHAERVLELLDPLHGEVPQVDSTTAMTLRGQALVALGRLEEGTQMLRVAGRGTDPPHAEALCALAAASVAAGRLHEADSLLDALLDDPLREPELAARALELYGHIEVARERQPVAARYYLDALAQLDCARVASPSLREALVTAIAAIAVNTFEPRLFARVRNQLAERSAPARPFVSQRVAILGELLAGEAEQAWALAFGALRAVPAGIRYVAALLDAALVCGAAGERFTPAQLVVQAAQVAQDVDWTHARSEERQTLLRLVSALAPIEPVRAGALLAAYEAALGNGEPPTTERAALGLARASLAGAMDRPREAATRLREAVAAARRAGSHYDEAEALLALAQQSAEPEVLERADHLTAVVPRSWLRRRYETLAERARGPERLSPAERRVMHAICEGLTTQAIATRFGRSKNTIRNQTRHVFSVLDVRSRSQLVSKCAAMGLLHQREPAAGPWEGA